MKTSVAIRFAILGVLWLGLVLMLLVRTHPITLKTIFVILASGIVVFVPMYKKYVRPAPQDSSALGPGKRH